MAIELAPFNIQVNAIAPLFIETDMTEPVKTMPQLYQEVIARTPAARWGNPDELAGTENRIATARMRYNERVQEYNTSRRRFPANVTAKVFGFKDYPLFEAPPEARQVPKVDFSK